MSQYEYGHLYLCQPPFASSASEAHKPATRHLSAQLYRSHCWPAEPIFLMDLAFHIYWQEKSRYSVPTTLKQVLSRAAGK